MRISFFDAYLDGEEMCAFFGAK